MRRTFFILMTCLATIAWSSVVVRANLPDSKSGRKTVILNAPALSVLNGLERVGPYVVPGVDPRRPRHDLKRPWDAVTNRARLTGVRHHDLRHNSGKQIIPATAVQGLHFPGNRALVGA